MECSYDGTLQLTKTYRIQPRDLYELVSDISPDLTLYDIFDIVSEAKDDMPWIVDILGIPNFDLFMTQLQSDESYDSQIIVDNILSLELYWMPSYDVRIVPSKCQTAKQHFLIDPNLNYWDNPYRCEMSTLMSLHGVGDECPLMAHEGHECGNDCPHTSYGIEFTPLNLIRHIPIRLNDTVKFYPPFVEIDRDFLPTKFTLRILPTLHCLLSSIFWELTFAGDTPEEIKRHSDKIFGERQDDEDR